MSKLTNGQNVDNFEKREKLRLAIIVTSIVTIILAFLSLAIDLGIGYALVFFFITVILKRMRNKTEVEISEELKKKKAAKKKKNNKITKKKDNK